jgi:hypothetical protein
MVWKTDGKVPQIIIDDRSIFTLFYGLLDSPMTLTQNLPGKRPMCPSWQPPVGLVPFLFAFGHFLTSLAAASSAVTGAVSSAVMGAVSSAVMGAVSSAVTGAVSSTLKGAVSSAVTGLKPANFSSISWRAMYHWAKLRWNSWTAFLVEVSGRKLKSSRVSRFFSGFLPSFSLHKMLFRNRLEFSCFADLFVRILTEKSTVFFIFRQ